MNAERAKAEAAKVLQLNPPPKQMALTGPQLGICLVFDAQIAALEVGAKQLGGFLNEKAAADVLVSAQKHLFDARERMLGEWQRAIQIAQPADMAKLVQP